MDKKKISVMSWNIANPSIKRVGEQIKWLLNRNEDVFVLTETKNSEGCTFLEKYLSALSYKVVLNRPLNNEYGVMIISKLSIIKKEGLFDSVKDLSSRIISVNLQMDEKEVEITGVYVPSRDNTQTKINKKKDFLDNLNSDFDKLVHRNAIFCGDLNILDKGHIPKYNNFFAWEYDFHSNMKTRNFTDAFRHFHEDALEYSWVGRTGDGYRYDHCFITNDILPNVIDCYYVHEPRQLRLSDHSAIVVKLEI